MQVQLLKKTGVLHFTARCIHSNAILRFESDTPANCLAGDMCHVTDCVFSNPTKIVRCHITHKARHIEAPAPPEPTAAVTPSPRKRPRQHLCWPHN